MSPEEQEWHRRELERLRLENHLLREKLGREYAAGIVEDFTVRMLADPYARRMLS